jgi:hypothetical protein
MNHLSVFLCSGLLATSAAIAAGPAPLELKGLHVGENKEKIRERASTPLRCQDQRGPGSISSVCVVEPFGNFQTLAEEPVKFWSIFLSEKDEASLVIANLAATSYLTVSKALQTKYGKPTAKRTVPVQNRMGASFTNEQLEWTRGDQVLTVAQYGADIETMVVTLGSKRLVSAPHAERDAKKAKDL